MKIQFLIFFLFCNSIVFSQTKEDMLACLELIFEQDDFQPAFENDVVSSGAVVLFIINKNRYDRNKFEQVKSTLRDDDFYDFDQPVEIYNGNNGKVSEDENLLPYLVNFTVGGTENNYRFMLDTVIRNENFTYQWLYNLVKTDGEWEIEGRSLNKRKAK